MNRIDRISLRLRNQDFFLFIWLILLILSKNRS